MESDVFSFAFIADAQIGMNSPSGLRGPASDKERLDRAIAYVNENDVAFVIFGGDQIDDADNEKTDAELDVLDECLSELTVPYYGVIGNHEQGDPSQSWRYVERGLPVRFSLSHQNAYFVGVNSSWLKGDFGDECARKEWEYLETRLREVPRDCEHRFAVMHWPLFNYHPGEEDTYWNIAKRDQLIDLFTRHEVTCVLSGHWQQDIDARWKGISLITSIGTSLPLQYPEELSFKVVTVFRGGWSARRVSVARD